MTDATLAMLDRWHAGETAEQPLDVATRVHAPDDGGCDAGIVQHLGRTRYRQDRERYHDALGRRDLPLYVPVLPAPKVPTPRNRRFLTARATLDGIVYGIIAERRRRPGEHDDLLALLMEARDEKTGEGMSDKQLRDEVITLFLAGHETTANALTWASYLLSTHVAVARRAARRSR